MNPERIYLDHNATSPLRPAARAAMIEALDAIGNPSSVHAEGRRARGVVETARVRVAALIGARAADVVFASGASEANATVMAAGWDGILAAGLEHESVLRPAEASGARVVTVPTGRDGIIDTGWLAALVLKGGANRGRWLVALQLANHETGVIQPVAEVAAFGRAHGLFVHCDAVQAAGRSGIDVTALGVHSLTVSSHKMGGPKGAAALFVAPEMKVKPLIAGGGQERRRRAGTENVAAIAGFGAAAEEAGTGLARAAGRLAGLRDRLERGLLALEPGTRVVGRDAPRLPNTTCIVVPGQSAETMVIRLDLAGVSVSAGSACSSGKVGASAVLAAMGLDEREARSGVRFSLGWTTREEDIDEAIARWPGTVPQRSVA